MAEAAIQLHPLNVVHVVRPAEGGIRRHVSVLSAFLPSLGANVFVAGPRDFTLEQITDRPAPGVFPIPISASPHPINDFRAAIMTYKFAMDADIIHGHGLRGGWIAALAAHVRLKPFVITAHNLAPKTSGLKLRLLEWTLQSCSAIICVSRAVADSLPISSNDPRIQIIPNGIECAQFPTDAEIEALNLSVRSDLSLVVGVGRLSPEKGFDLLIRAVKLEPEIQLIIAGEGPERTRLQNLADELGISNRVKLIGRIENGNVLIRAAKVVVVPSRSEGQGIVALEAMAMERPVVATKVGGLQEVVLDGQTGILVSADSPEAIASAIKSLIYTPTLCGAMGQAGRHRVEQLFTLESMLTRTVETYHGALITARKGLQR